MKKTSYSELTKEEKKKAGNGCGLRIILRPPVIPEFTASCDQHDFYYARGGTFKDKLKADLQFYAYLILDSASTGEALKMLFYPFISSLYFIFVSIFGIPFFKWGKYKTKKEILNGKG